MAVVKHLANPGTVTPGASIGLLLLRLGAAALLVVGHGWPKLARFEELAEKFPDPFGMGPKWSLVGAVGAEVLCAALVGLGLFTRVAAAPVVFVFAVAVFQIHAEHPLFAQGGGPSKEMALIYALPFLALLFTGAGRFSVDARLSK